jgi:thioredoxin:protein disulfide reductase
MFDSINDWVSSQLAAGAGIEGLLLLFVGGVLASLLPCVYPLYPITVTILRGRNSRFGRAAHPLAYYAGLAAVYMSFGVIAAFTGGSFNTLVRTPAFNLGVGALMAALAGSLIGLLEFPVLQASGGSGDDADEDDSRLLGTAAMGAGAGLLSSACVGPVVVSVLVALVVHAEALTVGVVASAAANMLLFGLGVGLPVVLIGVFGLALPRAGRFMIVIQWLFAGLIAYFALGYMGKGLVGLGLSEASAHAVEFGAAMVLLAALFLQDRERPLEERGRHAFLVLAAVAGFFVMARGLLPGLTVGGTSGAGASAGATSGEGELTEVEHGLTWHLDRDRAYEEAARTGKSVFIDFYGSWCSNCKAFQKRVASDDALREALAGAVLLKVYDTAPLFALYRDDERFPELAVGLPFFLITDAKANVLYKTNDFTKTDEMKLFLEP